MPPHLVSGTGATIMIGVAHDHVKKKLNSNIRTDKIMTGSGGSLQRTCDEMADD